MKKKYIKIRQKVDKKLNKKQGKNKVLQKNYNTINFRLQPIYSIE